MGELGAVAGAVGAAVVAAVLAWLRDRSQASDRRQEANDALYTAMQRLAETHDARAKAAEAAAANWRRRCDEEIASALAKAAEVVERVAGRTRGHGGGS